MKQCFINRSRSVTANSATDYTCLLSPMDQGGNEQASKIIWLPEGTFSNLIVTLNTAPGAGKSWTCTVRRSAASFGAMADTALTVTISDAATTARDTTHSFTTPAGGCFLALKWTPSGTPTSPASTGIEISIEFDSTNVKESGHSFFPYVLGSTAGKRNGLFSNTGTSWTTAAGAAIASVAAVAGTISALALYLADGASGGTDHVTVVIYKNGVKQDGTGGTVNTTTDLGPSDTRKVQTFSLSCAPGDYFWVETTVMSTFGNHCGVGVLFTATTDGQSNFCGQSGNLNVGVNPAFATVEGGGTSWNSPEASFANHAAVSSFTLSGFQVLLETAPGSAKTWTFDFRRNSSSPGPSIAITGSGTLIGSDTTNSAGIADGDTINLKSVPTSSPAVGNFAWAMIQTDSFTAASGATRLVNGGVVKTRFTGGVLA